MAKNLLNSGFLAALVFGLGLLASAREAGAQTPISSCGPINAPGAYILTNNLTTSGDCLTINANNVSIDLNGFTMFGDGTGSGIVSGVLAIEGFSARNGTVKSFNVGLSLFGNTMLIDRVQAIRNTTKGLGAVESISVKDSTFAGNGIGLTVGPGSVLTGNIVNFNNGTGIQAGRASMVASNTVNFNQGEGIIVGQESTLTSNAAASNLSNGYDVGIGSMVSNNTATHNAGSGFVIACGSNVFANSAADNALANYNLQGAGCNVEHNLDFRTPQ